MANMSYCQFENTHGDLLQCYRTMKEAVEDGQDLSSFMKGLSSDDERHAFADMQVLLEKMSKMYAELASALPVLDDEIDLSDRCFER